MADPLHRDHFHTSHGETIHDWSFEPTAVLDLPTRGDRVAARGHPVLSGGEWEFRSLAVPAGSALHLAGVPDRPTILRVGTLQVLKGGRLHLDATRGEVEVRFLGLPQAPHDAGFFGTGLVCHGDLVAEGGARRRRAGLRAVSIDRRRVTLAEEPWGWRPGDLVAVTPGSRSSASLYHNPPVPPERRRVKAVAGFEVELDVPLDDAHEPAWPDDERGTYRADVVNLTCSARFTSEDPLGVRGHVLVGEGGRPAVRHCLFSRLGRTTQAPGSPLGRYAFHEHMRTSEPIYDPAFGACQGVLDGCVLEDPDGVAKWLLVDHDTCWLVRTNLVVWGGTHAGMVTEVGTECYNLYAGCTAIAHSKRSFPLWQMGVQNWYHDLLAVGGDAAFYFPAVGRFQAKVPKTPSDLLRVEWHHTHSARPLGWAGQRAYHSGSVVAIDHRRGNAPDGWVLGPTVGYCLYGNVDYGRGLVAYDADATTIHGWTLRGASVDVQGQPLTRLVDCDIRHGHYALKDMSNGGRLEVVDSTLEGTRCDALLSLSQSAGAGPPVPYPGKIQKETLFDGVKLLGQRKLAINARQDPNVPSRVPVLGNKVEIQNHQGETGVHLRAFSHAQHADAPCPATEDIPPGEMHRVGAPEAGLSNRECWEKYGVAVGGEVAPAECFEAAGFNALLLRLPAEGGKEEAA